MDGRSNRAGVAIAGGEPDATGSPGQGRHLEHGCARGVVDLGRIRPVGQDRSQARFARLPAFWAVFPSVVGPPSFARAWFDKEGDLHLCGRLARRKWHSAAVSIVSRRPCPGPKMVDRGLWGQAPRFMATPGGRMFRWITPRRELGGARANPRCASNALAPKELGRVRSEGLRVVFAGGLVPSGG